MTHQPAAARMGDIPDNGPVIVGVTWFLLLFCGAFLAVRLSAKVGRGEGFWWDDWILLFSWVLPFPSRASLGCRC